MEIAKQENDDLLFDEEDESSTEKETALGPLPWKILVVDDEELVRLSTFSVLDDFTFMDRKVKFLFANSKAEAILQLESHSNVALLLLDVVMEVEHAGLELVNHIRNNMNNQIIQIIIRTGQPGKAPEENVMRDYQIAGYLQKAEADVSKIKSQVISGLRNYRNLLNSELRANMRQRMFALFGDLAALRHMYPYERKILEELCRVIGMESEQIQKCSAVYGFVRPSWVPWDPSSDEGHKLWKAVDGHTYGLRSVETAACAKDRPKFDREKQANREGEAKPLMYFFSTLGRFEDLTGLFPTPPAVQQAIAQAYQQKKSLYEKDFSLIYYVNSALSTKMRGLHFIYLENFTEFEREMVDFFFATMREVIHRITEDFV